MKKYTYDAKKKEVSDYSKLTYQTEYKGYTKCSILSPNSTRNFKSELAAEKPMRVHSLVHPWLNMTKRHVLHSIRLDTLVERAMDVQNETRVPRKIGGTDKQKRPLPGKSYESSHKSSKYRTKEDKHYEWSLFRKLPTKLTARYTGTRGLCKSASFTNVSPKDQYLISLFNYFDHCSKTMCSKLKVSWTSCKLSCIFYMYLIAIEWSSIRFKKTFPSLVPLVDRFKRT